MQSFHQIIADLIMIADPVFLDGKHASFYLTRHWLNCKRYAIDQSEEALQIPRCISACVQMFSVDVPGMSLVLELLCTVRNNHVQLQTHVNVM
jgi:hypothetical protein